MGSRVSRPTSRTSFSVISANARAADRCKSTLSLKDRVDRERRGSPVKKLVSERSERCERRKDGVSFECGMQHEVGRQAQSLRHQLHSIHVVRVQSRSSWLSDARLVAPPKSVSLGHTRCSQSMFATLGKRLQPNASPRVQGNLLPSRTGNSYADLVRARVTLHFPLRFYATDHLSPPSVLNPHVHEPCTHSRGIGASLLRHHARYREAEVRMRRRATCRLEEEKRQDPKTRQENDKSNPPCQHEHEHERGPAWTTVDRGPWRVHSHPQQLQMFPIASREKGV